MKKHFPFAEILIVRTKTPLATRVTTNRVEPADRDQLPAELWKCLSACCHPHPQFGGRGKESSQCCLVCIAAFPLCGGRTSETGQKSRARNKGAIGSLMGTFLPGWRGGLLRTPPFVFWLLPSYSWKGVWSCLFTAWTLPQQNPSSSVKTLPRTPPGGSSSRCFMISKLDPFLLETQSPSLLRSLGAIYLEKRIQQMRI